MKFKQLLRAGMFVLVLCALATAFTYTWDDGGGDHDWDTCWNWGQPGISGCVPDSPSDDALIPDDGGSPWTVDLITESIDDLTIEGDVYFGAAEADPALKTDSVTISASGGADIEVTMNDHARIITY